MFGWLRAAFSVPAPYSALPALQLGSPWSGPDELSRISLSDLYPGITDDSDLPVTRQQAESVPAVAACRHRIVGTLSRLPIKATRTGGVAGDDAAVKGYLLTQPDPAEPYSSTMSKTYEDLLFDGVAYWGVTGAYSTGSVDGDVSARPWTAVHVPLDQLDVEAGTGRLSVRPEYVRWLQMAKGATILDIPGRADGSPWLLRFDGPGPGLCRRPRAIRSALNLDRATAHAANNPVPSIELHQTTDDPMTKGEIQEMISEWTAARQRGGVGYTNSAIDLRTHGQDVAQLLIDGRNQQAVEIARAAGIPSASIDAGIPGTALTYANLQDRLTDLVNFGLQMYAQSVIGRLSMNDVIPRGITARIDYSELYATGAAGTVPTSAARPGVPSPTGA